MTVDAEVAMREMAEARIGDLVRQADSYRLSRLARGSRAGQRRGTFVRIARSAGWLLAWPIKH